MAQRRARLHTGVVTTSAIRISHQRVGEKRTKPGSDIRDFEPAAQGCSNCGSRRVVPGLTKQALCRACDEDHRTVRAARAELRRLRLPPLEQQDGSGKGVQPRRRGQQALERLAARRSGKRKPSTPRKKPTKSKAKAVPAAKRKRSVSTRATSSTRASRLCPKCRIELPKAGGCPTCD